MFDRLTSKQNGNVQIVERLSFLTRPFYNSHCGTDSYSIVKKNTRTGVGKSDLLSVNLNRADVAKKYWIQKVRAEIFLI